MPTVPKVCLLGLLLAFSSPSVVTTTGNGRSNTQTTNAQECQAICRNTPGCQIFQWMPKVWKESGQCRLKTMKPKWTQHEWYLIPNAISGPPICTRKMINLPNNT